VHLARHRFCCITSLDCCLTVFSSFVVPFCQRMGQSQYFPAVITCALTILLCLPSGVSGQQIWSRWKRQVPPHEWNPWRSPLERFDRFVHTQLNFYGEFVKGFSIPMYLEDTVWDPEWSEYPQWFLRRINCFLGIPYAMAPVGRRRFQVILSVGVGLKSDGTRSRPPIYKALYGPSQGNETGD